MRHTMQLNIRGNRGWGGGGGGGGGYAWTE